MMDEKYIFSYENIGKKDRLDAFLALRMGELTRSRLQGLIKSGSVLINGKIVRKPGQTLICGDNISLFLPLKKPSLLQPEAIKLAIIFENDDLILINKPAGMVVHPSPGHDQGTLVHAVLSHIPDLEGIGGEVRPGIVHRLDKDTSGLIIVAKNEHSYYWLQEQFRSRKVEKTYLALVEGRPPSTKGRIEAPIGRNSSHRKMMAVVPIGKGREAISEYRVVREYQHQTLLEVRPFTGRTHQIRVHLAFLGCPIVGDTVYGKKMSSIKISRQFLHASKIKIILPGAQSPREFEACLPTDLIEVLDMISQGVN